MASIRITVMILLVFGIGMVCAVDTVSAKKPVAKVKKNKKYVLFKYKAKLKRNYYDKHSKKHKYQDTVVKHMQLKKKEHVSMSINLSTAEYHCRRRPTHEENFLANG